MERTKRTGAVPAEVPQEIVGQKGETGPLGRQDELDLAEGLLEPYAVTAKGGLRLRVEPTLDAPVITVLPCGAGVFGDGEPGPDGWRYVFTGRLSGWMMNRHLEPLLGALKFQGLGHDAK